MNWWKTQFLFTFVVACCTICRYLFQNLKLTYVIYYKMNLREKRLKILALKVLKATKGEISEFPMHGSKIEVEINILSYSLDQYRITYPIYYNLVDFANV